ncbi:family 43 glycosylhydrolase [Bacillus salipaludis]|uniref:Family 43 glycosylhydrolase n=1 Tax=Bacillus salipaludis TaxID=2547811 RepID=A0ABW8R9I1_9BACI
MRKKRLKRKIMLQKVLVFVFVLCLILPSFSQNKAGAAETNNTFTNPIVPVSGQAGSADPSVVYKDGYYYYVKSDRDASIIVAKAKRLQDIGTAPRVTVYTPPSGTKYSKEIWAPELQYLNGKWYIYFAADDGRNENHRMYVLEGNSQDPQGTYTLKGKISDSSDMWAIDGMAFQKEDGSLYFVWSGWRNANDGMPQRTYIAPMSNPWTISGPRVEISSPSEPWEGTIQEGHEVIMKDGTISIIYSANGSWMNDYVLGQLTNSDGDVLNPASWTKKKTPVFVKNPEGQVYGPGHHGFTKSPDGKEDWIVYHAFKNSNGGWANRSVRAQKFTWNEDGTPNFGTAVGYGAEIQAPSGTPSVTRVEYEAESAKLGGNAFIRNSANASGGKVVGRIDNENSDYVQFDVEVKDPGLYTLIVMAANGTSAGAKAEHTVSVNGGPNQAIEYKNYGWENYNPSSMDVNLNAGKNTIKLSKKSNFAEVDRIVLQPVETSNSEVPVESVKFENKEMAIGKGETATVTASIRPIIGTDKNLKLSSSDSKIVTVSEFARDTATGSVTLALKGLEAGTAAVKAESADGTVAAEIKVTVRNQPGEPDLSAFTVDQFSETTLDSRWSIFQESKDNWSLTKNPGSMTIHTTPTDIYQNNNSQNNVFLQNIEAGKDFEIVTKVTAPIAKNHQQAGLFVWQDADNLVKLAHVWVDGPTIETAYEIKQIYRKPGNFAAHPGGDTMTLKIRKVGNKYTTYYWDGYEWIQAADSLTADLKNIKVGFFANNIVATNDRIDAKFDYFAVRTLSGGVKVEEEEISLKVAEKSQLENVGPSENVKWSSKNPSIATVTDKGLVEAKSAGRTIIYAEDESGSYKDQVLVNVLSDEQQPDILFQDDFNDNAADGWKTYGGSWSVTDGKYTVKSGPGHKTVLEQPEFTDYILEADVQITKGTEAGLIFRASDLGVGADTLEGYFLGINTENKYTVLGQFKDGKWTEIASRKIPINYNEPYHLKVVVYKGHIQAFINDNPLNENSYPKFDLVSNTHLTTGKVGFRTWNADATFDNLKVSPYVEQISGPTYTNSVMPGIADPYVLYHEGVYYLYGTHTNDWPKMQNGIKVYTSTDLVNWKAHDEWALHKDNSWGENRFWAPEVIEKNGKFYMYYAVEERLAVATSDSPLGPFVQEKMEPIHPNTPEIDAHIFTDDDGKQYMYFVRFEGGNVIYVAELNDDMKSIKEDTVKFVMRASQDWEKSTKQPSYPVNEGAFVIKHKDTYYLTYSANHFESPDYGVGYATAPTPMGPWTKYEYNPIMKSNIVVPGAGHHSLIHSPDGSELFMVYHTHNSTTATEPRKLAIDRVHFVPQENGPDIMEVWGPTVTPQPMPSNKIELDSVKLAAKHTTLFRTETSDLEYSGSYSNGKEADLKEAALEYVTSNKDIVSVENGEIIAHHPGTAEVFVNVTLNGVTVKSNVVTIHVTTSLEWMKYLIEGYEDTGTIQQPLAAQLRNSIDQAKHQLDIGNKEQAIKKMNDFLKHLNNKAMEKFIADGVKEDLNADAIAIISKWN